MKSLSLAIYRQSRKRHPTLPKCIIDVHEALSTMTVKTSRSEDMCLVNDVDSHIIILSCTSNLRVLCTQVKEIFIDGTFKCCPKFFEQLYTIHGYSNGHYIPLVFALLVSKSEDTNRKFLQHVIDICSARNLTFKPAVVHVDLEITVHNVFRQRFPETSIQCCRFHLGQSGGEKFRRQDIPLNTRTTNQTQENGLNRFLDLPFWTQVMLKTASGTIL